MSLIPSKDRSQFHCRTAAGKILIGHQELALDIHSMVSLITWSEHKSIIMY